MKTRNAVLASALAFGAALFGHGCADDRASVQIQSVCAPPDTCAFSGACEAQYISWPTLDTAASATDTVFLYLQVENQLPDNGNPDIGRLNTNDAHVDEAVIEYEGFPLPKAVVGSNFNIPASETSVVKVEVISSTAGTALGAFTGEVVANLRLRGYYDDGTRFETGEFPITVRICSGCVGLSCAGGPSCPPNSDGQLPISCPTP
jgi:hypothetical protein